MEIRPRKIADYLGICWRRKNILFLMALAMLIATYIIIRRVPNIYESRAVVVVTNFAQSSDDKAGGTVTQSIPIAAVMQHLTSYGNLALLIHKYKLYPEIDNFELALARLQKDIKIDIKNRSFYPEGPESITLTYRHQDIDTVEGLIKDLVANFERANNTINLQSDVEGRRLAEKVSEVEEQLKRLGPQRDIDLMKNSEENTIRAQRSSVETYIESLSDKEYGLEKQISYLQQQIKEQEVAIKASAAVRTSDPNANAALGALLVRKSELEAQIKDYSTQYTEKNPKLVLAKSQLTEVLRQIARIEKLNDSTANSPTNSLTPEVAELNRMKMDLSRLETDLEVTRRDLGRKNQTLQKLPNVPDKDPVAAAAENGGVTGSDGSRAEYERLNARYQWLLNKQDANSKLTALSSAGPMFQIVDPPHRPNAPVAPNRMLLLGLAFGLAMIFGLLIVFAIEVPRMFMINDEADVEYYLGAPVLAMIPQTMTRYERSRDRRLKLARGFALLVLASVLVPGLIYLVDRLKIFQLLGTR